MFRLELGTKKTLNNLAAIPLHSQITMLLSSKTFQRRFYSSWVTSTSLFQEMRAALVAPAPAPSALRPSCLMLPALRDKSTGDTVYRFFNPIDKTIFKIDKKKSLFPNTARCFWSYHGWLSFIDPIDCALYLWDPFSVSTHVFTRFPSIETLPRIVGTTRKFNNHSFFIKSPLGPSKSYTFAAAILSRNIIRKVVSSSPFAFDDDDNNNNNDCLFMALGGTEANDLFFCKPGDTWTDLSGPLHPYPHIVPSSIKDKVFYTMADYGGIEAWDLRDLSCIKRTIIDYKRSLCTPKMSELEAALRPCSGQQRYLVESSGDLLLVYRYIADMGLNKDGTIRTEGLHHIPHKTLAFDVYKLDISLGVWTYVNSLGDRALFVGLSNSFSLHVCDYPGLRPNSIYFADDCDRTPHKDYLYGGHDMGVYNLEDNSIEPFYPFANLKRIVPAPFWVAPNPRCQCC